MSWLRYAFRWVRWWLQLPYKLGDPALGSGEQRQKNRELLIKRYYDREPKRMEITK